MPPEFKDLREAYAAWWVERNARDGWIRRAETAEHLVGFYKSAFDKLLESIVNKRPELPPYCTKHGLFHGQKSPSCRPNPTQAMIDKTTNKED